MKNIIVESTVTCPYCGHEEIESMPTDNFMFLYECKSCGNLLIPKLGECCVFCCYGSVKCPAVQAKNLAVSGSQAKVGEKSTFRLVVECDQMLSSDKNSTETTWILMALDRDTREIVGVHMGDRSAQAAQALWDSLPESYRHNASYADFWESCHTVLPELGTGNRFQADRTFSSHNAKTGLIEWFFSAREGTFGPYISKEQAKKMLAEFMARKKAARDDGGRSLGKAPALKLSLQPVEHFTDIREYDPLRKKKGKDG